MLILSLMLNLHLSGPKQLICGIILDNDSLKACIEMYFCQDDDSLAFHRTMEGKLLQILTEIIRTLSNIENLFKLALYQMNTY